MAFFAGLGRVFASIGPVLDDVAMLAGRHNDQKGGEKGHGSHFEGPVSAWSGDKRGKSGENRGRGAVEKTPEPTRALKLYPHERHESGYIGRVEKTPEPTRALKLALEQECHPVELA